MLRMILLLLLASFSDNALSIMEHMSSSVSVMLFVRMDTIMNSVMNSLTGSTVAVLMDLLCKEPLEDDDSAVARHATVFELANLLNCLGAKARSL